MAPFEIDDSAACDNFAAMTDVAVNMRIVRSRRVLYGWERGGAMGKPEDVARIVREEIAALEAIIAEHPEKSLTVGDLVKRWKAFGEKVNQSAH